MKSHEPTGSPLTSIARRETIKRIFPPSLVASNEVKAIDAQPREIARVIRIPDARSNPRPASSSGEANGLGAWLSSRREETVRQLETWQAPALPDEVVETLATIFLMQPRHRLMPFFVWLEDRLRR